MPAQISKPFQEQIALITGGATGIGYAFSQALLFKGIGRVVIASRRDATLKASAASLNRLFPGDRAIPIAFDIRDRESTEELTRQI